MLTFNPSPNLWVALLVFSTASNPENRSIMATRVTMRTMFQSFGLSQDVSTFLYDNEEITTLVTLSHHDVEESRQLFKTVRNPGGGENGLAVPNGAVKNFIKAAFYCKMQIRVGREVLPGHVRPGDVLEAAAAQMPRRRAA